MTKSAILEQNKTDIINDYKTNVSISEIGKKYNCNRGLVYLKFKEWQIEIPESKKYSKAAKERLYTLIEYLSNNKDYGMQKIANILQCSLSFVQRAFKNLKIDYSHRIVKINFLNHNEVGELYKSGLSLNQVADKLNCAQITVFNILKKLGINTRPMNIYKFNRTIIDNGINTPELAWMWGLWLTDGNVMHDRIRIGMCDKDCIDKLKLLFEYTGPINSKKDKMGNRKEIYELSIYNTELAKKFVDLGCIKNKTHNVTFPSFISNEFLPHFIRGVMDGDGSILKSNCSITGNFSLIQGIIQVLIRETSLKAEDFHIYNRHPKRNNNIRCMMLTKKSTIKTFLDWIYKDSTEQTRMNRKYQKYKELWCNN